MASEKGGGVIETDPLIADVDHERSISRGAIDCPTCIEHIERREQALEDLHNATVRIRELERKVKKLENDDKQKPPRPKKNDNETLRAHRLYPQAQECFKFWVEHISPRAKEFSGKRLRNVLDRLEAGYTVKQIKLSIYGAARHPLFFYGKKRDGLDYICGDPSRLDDYMTEGLRALAEDEAAGLAPAKSKAEHDERRAG